MDAARAACIARRPRGPWHACRGRAAHATGQPAAARRAARRVQCTATPAAWAKRRPAAGRTEAEGGPAQGLRGAPAVAPRAILGAHMPTRAWLRAQMRRAARLASSRRPLAMMYRYWRAPAAVPGSLRMPRSSCSTAVCCTIIWATQVRRCAATRTFYAQAWRRGTWWARRSRATASASRCKCRAPPNCPRR